MPQKPKTFCITRTKPAGIMVHAETRLGNEDWPAALCYDKFEQTTGLTLKPGETKKVQLVEVKP